MLRLELGVNNELSRHSTVIPVVLDGVRRAEHQCEATPVVLLDYSPRVLIRSQPSVLQLRALWLATKKHSELTVLVESL